VVLPAAFKPGSVDWLNHGTILGMESRTMAACQLVLSGLAIGKRGKQLVAPGAVLGRVTDRNASSLKDRFIEAACRQVPTTSWIR